MFVIVYILAGLDIYHDKTRYICSLHCMVQLYLLVEI